MGQAERDNWYFGVYAGVNFDGGTLTSLDDNVIERRIAFGQIEGPDNIAVVNDSVGNLLFYTDGRVFKNKFHQNLLNLKKTVETIADFDRHGKNRNRCVPDQIQIGKIHRPGVGFG